MAASIEFDVSLTDIDSRKRTKPVVLARQASMYLLRERQLPLTAIGHYFHRDHGTVSHALKTVSDLESTDASFAARLHTLRTRIARTMQG